MKRNILMICLIMMLAITTCIFNGCTKSKRTSEDKQVIYSENESSEKKYVEEDTKDMLNSLNSDKFKASKRYEGEEIEVSGYLIDYHKEDCWFRLGENKSDDPEKDAVIMCYLYSDEPMQTFNKKDIGQEITVKGEVVYVDTTGYGIVVSEILI